MSAGTQPRGRDLPDGQQVYVHELSRAPQYNGKSGTIEGYAADNGRYTVVLADGGKRLGLRRLNLLKRPPGRGGGIPDPAALSSLNARFVQIQQHFHTGDAAGAAARWADLLAEAKALRHIQHMDRVEYAIVASLGSAYGFLGRHTEAIEAQEQALAIIVEVGDRRGEAAVLCNVGNPYVSIGQYAKAIDCYERALAIAVENGDRHGEGTILGSLGIPYFHLGRHEEAIDHQKRALAIAVEIGDTRGEGNHRANLGDVYRSRDRHAESIEQYERTLAISVHVGDRKMQSTVLDSLGAAYECLGRCAEAINHHEQALAIKVELGDLNGQACILGNLGTAFSSLERHAEAINHHDQALVIAVKIGDRQMQAISLSNIAAEHGNTGRHAEAASHFAEAVAVCDSLRADLIDDHRVSIFVKQSNAYAGLVASLTLLGRHVEALLAADRSRSRALADLLGGLTVRPAPLGRTRSEEELEAAIKLSLGDVELASSDLQRTRSAIAAADGLSDWQAVASLAAGAKATLIFYAKETMVKAGRQNLLYTWVIKPPAEAGVGATPTDATLEFRAIRLPDGLGDDRLAGLVSDLGRGVAEARGAEEGSADAARAEADAVETLRALHAALIGPIAELLPPPATADSSAAPRLVFVPHDELCRVPFGALMGNTAEAQPLLAGYEVQVCNSLQVLKLTLEHAVAATTELDPASEALVVGYPSTDLPAVRLPWASDDMPVKALPGAAAEAAAVANALGCSALVGSAATKEAVLQRLQSAPVVHIATHGFVHESGDRKTVLLLHDDHSGSNSSAFLSQAELDPATMPLMARLVVLPACHSGRGDDRWTGEGLLGFGRSLLACGVPTVVLSLWSLPDKAAQALMDTFYQLLADTGVGGGPMQGSASTLLRMAILKQFQGSALKRRWSDWAPLQVLGAGTIRLPVPMQPIRVLSIHEFLEHDGQDSLRGQYAALLGHLDPHTFDDAALEAAGVRKIFHRKRLLRWQTELQAEGQAVLAPQTGAEPLQVLVQPVGTAMDEPLKLLVLNTTGDEEQDVADALRILCEQYSGTLQPISDKFPDHVRMVTSFKRALLILNRLPPNSGAVLCLCGFDEMPEPATIADVLRAVVACQPQCVILSGGGASVLKPMLESAGVPTIHWGVDVSADERKERLVSKVKQLLEAKLVELEKAQENDNEGRGVSKEAAVQWMADKASRLVAVTSCSMQQAHDVLIVCKGEEAKARVILKGALLRQQMELQLPLHPQLAAAAADGASAAEGLLPTMDVFEAMRPTRVMLSFAAADGGLHLARDLRSLLLERIWVPDDPADPQNPAQEAYLDSVNLTASKPGTTKLADGTTRNGHWAEFYLMGALCAHTVVLIIDDEYEASPYCNGELDGFLENCRRAQSFKDGNDQPEPEANAATGPAGERFPGSDFELVVLYEQDIFVGTDGAARMDALRAKLEAAGAGQCTFFSAWFSCFGAAAIVNPEASDTVEARRPAWQKYARQTFVEKSDRTNKNRVPPPRIPTSFQPHGIVGPNCAKSDGRHDTTGCGQTCAECEAERQRFIRTVQQAELRFERTPMAEPQDYCALYDHRWRKLASELQGGPTAAVVEAKADQGKQSHPMVAGSVPFDGESSGCVIA